MTSIRERIKGSIPALITPMKNGKVDEAAFRKFVSWQIEQGSQGLVPCGTTGESPTLDEAEIDLVIERTVAVARGRVPVFVGVGGTFWGVVLANLVPAIPFVVLVMIPFIEQIDPKIEAAARVFGAGTFKLFIHVLLPMLVPGILAALLLVLVRTVGMFELTFLTAGPTSQTLVVALYYSVFASGVRAVQSIDAMAVVYMITTLVWLLIALRFVNPTQIVARAKQAPASP